MFLYPALGHLSIIHLLAIQNSKYVLSLCFEFKL